MASEEPDDEGLGDVSPRSTASTALLRGTGSGGRISSATSPSRSSSAEKLSGLSEDVGRHDSTRDDRPTAWRACFHTVVLPIPISPVIVRAAGPPDVADRKAQMSAISPP